MKYIKKFNYTSILGWSVSRYDRFSNCKRQYFYDYYPKFDKDTPLEKIRFLKSLTSRDLETGNIVHDIIRDMFKRYQKSTKPLNKDRFFKYSYYITENYCSSKTFFEHHYNSEIILVPPIYAKVKNILENFINSSRFTWIEKNAFSKSSEWIIEPEGFGETRINDLKAFCKVDFLFPVADKIYIMDWKTGKPNQKKHSKQLTGYALWANYHFGKKIGDILPIIVYLYPQYDEKSVEINDCSLTEFAKTVATETQDMYGYLTDIEKNIPKDKKEFPLNDNKFLCKYCSYKEICPGCRR
ncbi:PD-(D/E)XK nuclease family protein [Candidatus Endomicrobiellum trichonymphae]|uniref:PD-(D/E)XK nuclease family protein n=1 Tax=Endomicrobium trichonymphae TaxID=1408204 RepID=UPI0039B9394D